MKTRANALACFALFAVATVWASGGAEAAGGRTATGEIVHIDGEVTVDEVRAVVGQDIARGATVRTGSNSVCEITWGESNIIRIQENTLAVLDVGARTPEVRLQSGSLAAVLNRVEAISKRGTFRVKTSSAAAGVRGTVFFVKVEDEDNTYICACYGELSVTPSAGADVALASTRHAARRFTRTGTSVTVAPAGLLYHDDAAMDALAQKVGYTVPWGQGGYGASTTGDPGY